MRRRKIKSNNGTDDDANTDADDVGELCKFKEMQRTNQQQR